MRDNSHLPQIQFYYEGYPYPFVGGASLKKLVAMRKQKLDSDCFWSYSKDARETFFEHMKCIEECIRILFSANPDPAVIISKIQEREDKLRAQEQRLKEENVARVLKIYEKYKAKKGSGW